MRVTVYDWGLTILIGFMLWDAIRNEKPLDCGNQPINTWMIGTIAMAFIARVIFHIHSLSMILNRYVVLVAYMLLVILIAFAPIWNFLGTLWMLINYFYGNKCLKSAAFMIVAVIQIVIYTILGSLYYLLIIEWRKYYIESWQKEKVLAKLTSVYTNEVKAKNLKLETFLHKYSVILQSTPLLDLERRLIHDLCTYQASKSKLEPECGICLNKIFENDFVSKVQCDHEFHYDCLIGWFEIKPVCPYCRKPFRPDLLRIYCESIALDANKVNN